MMPKIFWGAKMGLRGFKKNHAPHFTGEDSESQDLEIKMTLIQAEFLIPGHMAKAAKVKAALLKL